MAYVVRLSLMDFLDAVDVAVTRMRESALRGHRHTIRREHNFITLLLNNVQGTASELAVAKWIGIPWSRSVNTFHHVADVGEDIDVRSTDHRSGCLILRDKDHPYRWFVLVTGTAPNMVLQGYIRGADAMVPKWQRDPHDWGQAWFIPQSALIPITPDGVVPPCLRQTPQRATAPSR